jgi:hypothetical protein
MDANGKCRMAARFAPAWCATHRNWIKAVHGMADGIERICGAFISTP